MGEAIPAGWDKRSVEATIEPDLDGGKMIMGVYKPDNGNLPIAARKVDCRH